MILRWFLSKTVRHAVAMRKHVHRLLCAQRDILSPQAIAAIDGSLAEMQKAVADEADKSALLKQIENLEKAANKWLKAYPNPSWRENVEVLLVALAVAMGIRTFFLQPFKIPTGSMQPTLWGVTSVNLVDHPEVKVPTGLDRIRAWIRGTNYVHLVAKTDGELQEITPPWPPAVFSIFQRVKVGGVWHVIWFPPDYGSPPNCPPLSPLAVRAGLQLGQSFRKGDDIVRLQVNAGDHLFVDRLTYNFRTPQRGEIIVFATAGIPEEHRVNPPYWIIPPDQFYIKRLVALGGETVQIGSDRHLIINGHRLDSSTPHFENVYSFDPNKPAQESHFSGHTTGGEQARIFQDKPEGVLVPEGDYMVMGDNTVSSLDSRFWGPFPATAVIGKAFFVYWPISDRFGWGQH